MRPARPHAWYRRRLALPGLGALPEREERVLEKHLEGCADCRAEQRRLLTRSLRADAGHIPTRLIARWPRVLPRLRGSRRVLFRRHLEDCARCRGALRLLGHPEVIPVEPALEPVVDPVAGLSPAAIPATEEWPRGREVRRADTAIPQRLIPMRRPGDRERGMHPWMAWALGSWATLATAAALLVVSGPVTKEAGRLAPAIEGGVRGAGSLALGPMAVFGEPLRGAMSSADSVTVRLERGQSEVLVSLEGALVSALGDEDPAEYRIGVAVVTPAGTRLEAPEAAYTAVMKGGLRLQLERSSGETQHYRLELSYLPAPPTPTAVRQLHLSILPPE